MHYKTVALCAIISTITYSAQPTAPGTIDDLWNNKYHIHIDRKLLKQTRKAWAQSQNSSTTDPQQSQQNNPLPGSSAVVYLATPLVQLRPLVQIFPLTPIHPTAIN